MKTLISAHRLNEGVCGYTVLVRTSGSGNVDLSIWLNDAECRELAQQLLAAAEPTVPAATEAA